MPRTCHIAAREDQVKNIKFGPYLPILFFFKTPRYFRATAKTTESPCIGIFCLGKVLNKFNKGGKGVDGLSFKS